MKLCYTDAMQKDNLWLAAIKIMIEQNFVMQRHLARRGEIMQHRCDYKDNQILAAIKIMIERNFVMQRTQTTTGEIINTDAMQKDNTNFLAAIKIMIERNPVMQHFNPKGVKLLASTDAIKRTLQILSGMKNWWKNRISWCNDI